MNNIAIYGAGGFGREVQFMIDQINKSSEAKWNFIGYFDDGVPEGTLINGFKVLGRMEELNQYTDSLAVVFAIANPQIKRKVISSVTNQLVNFPKLIHPNVLLGPEDYLKIGEGAIITAGNMITVNIEIGKHVILNLGCTVGHDTIIKDYCSFMPSVNISGEVVIEECVYVGTGAKIINQLSIGENTIVGAGAVVSKSLPSNCTAVGVPAKPIKKNN